MKKRNWSLPIFFLIFIGALLFENASFDRLAVLVVLGMAFFSIEIVKLRMDQLSWMVLIIQTALVFVLEIESRFAVNYLFHLLYFLIILSVVEVEKSWKRYTVVGGILLASSYKFIYLLRLEANYENFSQSFFMMLVTTLLIVVVFLYGQLSREKEKTEALNDELMKKHQQLENYAKEVENYSMLKERTTLARDLHDSVGHSLTGLIMMLEMTSIAYNKSVNEGEEKLEDSKIMAREALKNLREAVDTLRQDTYSYDALKGMMASYANSISLVIEENITREYDQLSHQQRSTLYRLIQECMTNSVKHGEANRIIINVEISKDLIVFSIVDNGSGIDVEKMVKGNGLSGMLERVIECRGNLQFVSENGFSVKGQLRRE